MQLMLWKYVIPDPMAYFTIEPHFTADKVIDTASSVIWCERFQEPGEFQIVMKATPELLDYFAGNDLLITRADTNAAMIPEKIVLTTSAENGNKLTISGKSAEGIASLRIIPQTTTVTETSFTSAADALDYYLKENLDCWWYYHTDEQHPYYDYGRVRCVNVLHPGSNSAPGRSLTAQPFGQNLGDFITDACKDTGMGFRIRFDKKAKLLYHEFYAGTDRSSTVIFSPKFQNIGSTEFIIDKSTYYNFVYAAGEGEGKDRTVRYSFPAQRYGEIGLRMREKYLDARNISSNSDVVNGTMDYGSLLGYAAQMERLASQKVTQFSGEIIPGGQFRYRKDYFLGDKVSVRNDFGINGTATVTAVTEYEDENGFKVIPEFSEWVV